MATVLSDGTIVSSSDTPHFINQSLMNSTSYSQDHLFHLFLLTAIWIILILTIVFGTTGNILVLYVYINRNDKKTCSFFIKMLAIVDLLICLVLAPLELYQTTIGIQNEYLCKFYGFLTTHVLYSTLLITIIAFDRYFCICWPLYKIITIRRARVIVVICGILSSLLAVIPMSEYSTDEYILHLHSNHSSQFSIETIDDESASVYAQVEHFPISEDSPLPFVLGNITKVKCSPRFSLQLELSNFLALYRFFHSTLFASCIIFVFILYAMIYKAIYRRRLTRTRKLSTYQKIFRSYFFDPATEDKEPEQNSSNWIFCFCCKKVHSSSFSSSPSQTAQHRILNQPEEHSQCHDGQMKLRRNPPKQMILEMNGARGKRYSAISMTSMTYLTSGVWDDSAPSNLLRSRLNSVTATTFCGTENSLNSRPSTSTEDSFEQTTRLLTPTLKSSHMKSSPITSSTHLMVPGRATLSASSSISTDFNTKDLSSVEIDSTIHHSSLGNNFLHPSIVRKPSESSSHRQAARISDGSVHHRKVSFMMSSLESDRHVAEDPSKSDQQSSRNSSPMSPTFPHQSSLDTDQHLFLSMDHSNSFQRHSISSRRRSSMFDGETQRIFERQQRQERSANIRTTLTLFVVTATFILMYLPSILITLLKIKPYEFREVLFLLYYINSACNPLIYSFFNVNFRNDVRRIYECQKREYLA